MAHEETMCLRIKFSRLHLKGPHEVMSIRKTKNKIKDPLTDTNLLDHRSNVHEQIQEQMNERNIHPNKSHVPKDLQRVSLFE